MKTNPLIFKTLVIFFYLIVESSQAQNNTILRTNSPTHGQFNVSIGVESGGGDSTVIDNTFVGFRAGKLNDSGRYNSYFGRSSGYKNLVGNYNVFFGWSAGYANEGSNNVFLGAGSGNQNISGSYNVFIGKDSGFQTGSLSNALFIENSNSNYPLIYGKFDTRYVDVNGKFGVKLSNNSVPANNMEINSSGALPGTAGLRFTGFTSSSPVVLGSGKVLSVNESGDVILVDDNGGPGTADTSIYQADGTLLGNRIVYMNSNNMIFNTGGNTTTTGGRIYIGNTIDFTTGAAGTNFPVFEDINPANVRDFRLYVEGGILTERIKVALRNTNNWADYVFADDYQLKPLKEVEAFIKANKHLPGIESAQELVENGLDLGEMQAKQMGKIEELTLYIIEQDKKLEQQSKDIEELKALVKVLMDKK